MSFAGVFMFARIIAPVCPNGSESHSTIDAIDASIAMGGVKKGGKKEGRSECFEAAQLRGKGEKEMA